MISQEEAHRLFDYKDGKLYWSKAAGKRSFNGKRAGSYRYDGYRRINIEGKYYMEHRIIYLMFHGSVPKILDHKNRVRDDNRIENIAGSCDEMNNRNLAVRSDSTTKIPGVHLYKRIGRYVSHIHLYAKYHNLGYSDDIVEAAAKRLAAEQCLGVPDYVDSPAKAIVQEFVNHRRLAQV